LPNKHSSQKKISDQSYKKIPKKTRQTNNM
jgi:hypothetical protein